jgi:hypothetical protein
MTVHSTRKRRKGRIEKGREPRREAHSRRGTSKAQGPESGNRQNPQSACRMWRLMAHIKYERDAEKGLEQPGR